MSNILNTPVGANKKYLIKFNGAPFAGADTEAEAHVMIENYKKPPNRSSKTTTAQQGTWTVEDNR